MTDHTAPTLAPPDLPDGWHRIDDGTSVRTHVYGSPVRADGTIVRVTHHRNAQTFDIDVVYAHDTGRRTFAEFALDRAGLRGAVAYVDVPDDDPTAAAINALFAAACYPGTRWPDEAVRHGTPAALVGLAALANDEGTSPVEAWDALRHDDPRLGVHDALLFCAGAARPGDVVAAASSAIASLNARPEAR